MSPTCASATSLFPNFTRKVQLRPLCPVVRSRPLRESDHRLLRPPPRCLLELDLVQVVHPPVVFEPCISSLQGRPFLVVDPLIGKAPIHVPP